MWFIPRSSTGESNEAGGKAEKDRRRDVVVEGPVPRASRCKTGEEMWIILYVYV